MTVARSFYIAAHNQNYGWLLKEELERRGHKVTARWISDALVRAAKRETDVFRGQYEEINRLRQVCAEAGICRLLTHHTRKGISDGPSVTAVCLSPSGCSRSGRP